MRTALDTNILSAIWSDEPIAQALVQHLANAKKEGALLISPFVYAECLAHPKSSEAFANDFLAKTGVMLDLFIDRRLWAEAGLRFGHYAVRRRKSMQDQPRRLLADFLIGAHAVFHANRLMTLDPSRYKRDFPELRLYDL